MVSADYWLADYPELRQTTQPTTMGGPLGEPVFCIFCSTVNLLNTIAADALVPSITRSSEAMNLTLYDKTGFQLHAPSQEMIENTTICFLKTVQHIRG